MLRVLQSSTGFTAMQMQETVYVDFLGNTCGQMINTKLFTSNPACQTDPPSTIKKSNLLPFNLYTSNQFISPISRTINSSFTPAIFFTATS
jgi:hypothetical protein